MDKFREGARIRIAEPFLKTFMDGERGLRVESPDDVQFGWEADIDMAFADVSDVQ